MSAGATSKIAIQNALTFLQDRSNGIRKTCLMHAKSQYQSLVASSEKFYAVTRSCFNSRDWVALFVRASANRNLALSRSGCVAQ